MHVWALAHWSRLLIIREALLVLCSNPPIVRIGFKKNKIKFKAFSGREVAPTKPYLALLVPMISKTLLGKVLVKGFTKFSIEVSYIKKANEHHVIDFKGLFPYNLSLALKVN